MKTLYRILGAMTSLALAAPGAALAQQEPLIGVDITTIGVFTGSGSVISTKVISAGSGYIAAPAVTFSGGGGVGASARAILSDSAIIGLDIVNGGTGYTSLPLISIAPPGATATATAALSGPGPLTGITITSQGSNYTTVPTVAFSGGAGSGATATATISNGAVTGITLTNGGNYTVTPSVTIAPPGNTALATVQGLGSFFARPFQNESYGPVDVAFSMTAEARGMFPVGGFSYNFFVNGAALGSSVNQQPPGGGPGIIGWAPPQPGAYILTVTASDGAHTATSLPVRYFATGTAIIGQVDNTLVPNGSSVIVQATATPAPSGPNAFVQRMDFYVDNVLTYTDRTYPYSFIYTPAPSSTPHVVEARAFDNNDNQISPNGEPKAMRRFHMVSAIGTPPLVRIANPPNEGNVQAGTEVSVIADAVAPDGFIKNVDFYINGVLLSSSNTFPFTAKWKPAVPGRYQFVAIGFDDKSNAVASAPIMLTATGSFPTARIVEPEASGLTVVQGTTVPVTVNAAGPDGGVASLRSVEFLVDGVVSERLPKPLPPGSPDNAPPPVVTEPFIFNWKSNVPIGTHRLAVRATGVNDLSITSAEVTVNVVANQTPRIAITAPTASSSVTVGTATTITTDPDDTDGTIESVDFLVNGTRIGTATASPFRLAWTPANAGTFTLTARATDNGGKSATSEAVSITIDPLAPSGPGPVQQPTITATVYRGDYGAATESGRFAFALNRNNRGTLIAYSAMPEGRAYFWSDIAINPDGTFQVRDANNQVALAGQTSATGVSGSFDGKTFIGPVTSSTGAFTPLLLTGTLTGNPYSQVVAIVGGDSSITLYTATGTSREAGGGVLGATGNYSFASPTGGRLTGTVANSALIVSGSASGAVNGAFLLRQQASRISNISTRALAGSGDRTLVAGFVIGGSGTKPLLVRAVGPSLANFGVTSFLDDPFLNVVSRTGASVASNNDWGTSASAAALAAQVGAFPLTSGSRDAALQTSLAPGTYSSLVGGGSATAGAALIEIYDADTASMPTARITNISTRGEVGAGEALIAGFVITGDVRKKLLIRAVGPTLRNFGLGSVLADPKIDVMGGTTVIAANNDWTESAAFSQVSATSPTVGAFPLNADSKDAALVLQLSPGAYTVQISGGAGSVGTVLVEIYDADTL